MYKLLSIVVCKICTLIRVFLFFWNTCGLRNLKQSKFLLIANQELSGLVVG